MALPSREPPRTERQWAAFQVWLCPHCDHAFHPDDLREVQIPVFVPRSRWSFLWPGHEDRRQHTDMWLATCPACGDTARLLNPLNALLLDYKRRREVCIYAGVAGFMFNWALVCAYPPLVPFVILAVLIFWAVVAFTAPKAPWWVQ